MASKDSIKRLEMGNELMRDFLSLTEGSEATDKIPSNIQVQDKIQYSANVQVFRSIKNQRFV